MFRYSMLAFLVSQMRQAAAAKAQRVYWSAAFSTIGCAGVIGCSAAAFTTQYHLLSGIGFACGVVLLWVGSQFLREQE